MLQEKEKKKKKKKKEEKEEVKEKDFSFPIIVTDTTIKTCLLQVHEKITVL